MYAPKVQDWVRRRAWRMSCEALALACVTGVLALGTLLVIFAGFWMTAWLILETGMVGLVPLVSGRVVHADASWAALLAAAGVAGLIWANRWITRAHLAKHPSRRVVRPEDGSEQLVLPVLQSLAAYPGSASATLSDLLLCGPRLLSMTQAHLARAWRLRRMDPVPVSNVLALLMAKAGRLSYEELAWRAGLTNPPGTYRLLQDLRAVVFLVEEPSGLTLTSESRAGLLETVGPLAWEGGFGTETERNTATLRSLHEMLGLATGAGPGAVARAVRQRLSECDAVRAPAASAGLERAAAEHAASVQRAFQEYQSGRHPTAGAGREVVRVWEEQRREAPR